MGKKVSIMFTQVDEDLYWLLRDYESSNRIRKHEDALRRLLDFHALHRDCQREVRV